MTTNQEVSKQEDFNWDEISNNCIPRYNDLIKEMGNSVVGDEETINKFKAYVGVSTIKQVEKKSVINGKIVSITEKNVTIDISNKDNIIIDRRGSEEKICKHLSVGQMIDVLITDITDKPYNIKGSLSELVKIRSNEKMLSHFRDKTSFEAKVIEMIPAGYMMEIDIDGIIIEAFMPNTLADANRLFKPESIIGKTLTVMMETIQQDKGIFVVSRKRYLQSLIPEKIKEIKSAPKDKIYIGQVTGTQNFGIFVQFEDCLTGMIHKANIDDKYQDRISDIKPGSKIEFYVKDIIKNGSQIILTQKIGNSLWDTIRVGDSIKGKISDVKPFGALINLDYETTGLIQTSYINKSNKTLSKGADIDVVIISIVRDDRKIYLTFADDVEMVEKLKEKPSDVDKLKQRFNKN